VHRLNRAIYTIHTSKHKKSRFGGSGVVVYLAQKWIECIFTAPVCMRHNSQQYHCPLHWLSFRLANKMIQEVTLSQTASSWNKVGKDYHTPWGVLVGWSSLLHRPCDHKCRQINHSRLWRKASVMPDLRLPSQP